MPARNRGGAIAALLDSLGNGDPVAWGFVGLFVMVGGSIGLFALKIRRDHRREDEARAKRYGKSR